MSTGVGEKAEPLLLKRHSSGLFFEDDEPEHPSTSTATPSRVILLSGACAGMVSRTLTAPLDRLKTLMQVGKTGSSVMSGFVRIHREGGMRAFFQGNWANVVKSIPEFAIKFWTFERAKRLACRDPDRPNPHERLLAGAAAGGVSCMCIYPLEVAKTRMAVASAHLYSGVIHCLSVTLREEGARALVRGLSASLLGIIPFSAIDLALFNALKERLELRGGRDPSNLELFGCGAASCCVAQISTYPLALAKTKLQASGMPGMPAAAAYDGLAECLLGRALPRHRAQPAQGDTRHLNLVRRLREHQAGPPQPRREMMRRDRSPMKARGAGDGRASPRGARRGVHGSVLAV